MKFTFIYKKPIAMLLLAFLVGGDSKGTPLARYAFDY